MVETSEVKTTIEISNGVKTYKITSVGDEVYIENEREEAMTMPEKDLFDLVHEYFEREF